MEEQMENAGQTADTVSALAAELETLRQEKRRRQLLDCAVDLRARGLDGGFAPYLLGEDERQTARNIGDFEKHFTNALAREMTRRLPKETPADLSQTAAPRTVRRGIRKTGR